MRMDRTKFVWAVGSVVAGVLATASSVYVLTQPTRDEWPATCKESLTVRPSTARSGFTTAPPTVPTTASAREAAPPRSDAPFPPNATELPDCIQTWLQGGPLPIDGYVLIGVTCNLFEVWTTEEHAADVWLVGSEVQSFEGVPIAWRMTWNDCDCNRDGLWDGRDVQAYWDGVR